MNTVWHCAQMFLCQISMQHAHVAIHLNLQVNHRASLVSSLFCLTVYKGVNVYMHSTVVIIFIMSELENKLFLVHT